MRLIKAISLTLRSLHNRRQDHDTVVIIHNHPIHYKHLLFCELAKKGMKFEVLFTAGSSDARIEVPLPKQQEYVYSIGHPGSYETAGKLNTSLFVWRTLSRIRPGVVIISGWYDIAAWTSWAWAGLNKSDRVLWAESNVFDRPHHLWKEFLKKLFVKGCKCAHVYGTSNREYLEKIGMPTESIFIKRAVADTALFLKPPDFPSQKQTYNTLLYCGRFSSEKNLPMLLGAFAKVGQNTQKPRLALKLVGFGPLEFFLRQLVNDLGIAGLVDFVGKARQDELPKIFRTADVLILPSISEPWGLVVNEGMLSGLAIAVSNLCGCAADLVRPETGWSFSPFDEEKLTQLLIRIADTPRAELERMGYAARTLASEYSPENCAIIVLETVEHTTQHRRIRYGLPTAP